MDLKLLHLFLAVSEAGSFTKAAAGLSIAQSILSRQIRALERDVGADLFYRNGRGVMLTEAGKLFETYAQRVVSTMSEAITQVSALRDTPAGEVVIGLPPTVGAILTTPLVRGFRKEFPNVSLTIVEGFSGFVLQWLTDGRLDIAVLYNAPPTSSLVTEHLHEEQLYLFGAPPTNGLPAPAEPVTGLEITKLPLILPSRTHGLRILIDNAFARHNLTLKAGLEIDSLPSIRDLVVAGLGYTILPYAPMRDLVLANVARHWRFSDPEMTRKLVVATSGKRALTPTARSLIKTMHRLIADLRNDGILSPDRS